MLLLSLMIVMGKSSKRPITEQIILVCQSLNLEWEAVEQVQNSRETLDVTR